jgi:hypothetical protein
MAEGATDGLPTQILGIMPPENRPEAEYREGEDGVVGRDASLSGRHAAPGSASRADRA